MDKLPIPVPNYQYGTNWTDSLQCVKTNYFIAVWLALEDSKVDVKGMQWVLCHIATCRPLHCEPVNSEPDAQGLSSTHNPPNRLVFEAINRLGLPDSDSAKPGR